MTNMCSSRTIISLLFAVVCVPYRLCLSVKTSRACYGSDGIPCTRHTLVCSSGMISIQDAYFTNSTACTPGGLSRCYTNISNIPDTGRYRDFNETQLNNLYTKCSVKERCTLYPVRSSVFTFSVVKFMCINDFHNLCDQVGATTSDASLLWKGNNSSTDDHNCTCSISTLQSNTYFSLTALDMRFNNRRQICPGVTISVDGNRLPVNCSQLAPYQLLVNTSQQVQVTVNEGEAGVNGIVWLRIQGTNAVKLICNEKVTAATDIVKTSKACYGVQGPLLPCTKHTLECSSGMIAIQDAYYTSSTACGGGLSICDNINVSSIPDTGRYQNFSESQLVNLYKNCSNKLRCTFNVGRSTASAVFSIVKFICINDNSIVSGHTCTASPKSASYEFPGDMFVAGIFTGAVVLLMGGFLIYFLFIRRRFDLIKNQDAVPASVTHPTYADLSGPQQTDNYDVIKRQSQSQTSQPSLYENVAKTP